MSTLNRPVLKVEVAFTTDPNSVGAGSPTWTDITQWVRNLTFTRSGRQDELGRYQAGTAQLDLINVDGRFNVNNAAGPYFGNLKLYRPIRITATWLAVTYPLWQGYVERWPQTWDTPMLGLSPIECVDAFALLAQISLDSAYAAEVLADSPTVYYPLGEDSGTTSAGNASANAYAPADVFHTKHVNASTPATYEFGHELDVVGAASQTGLSFVGTNAESPGTPAEDGYALTLPKIPLNWSHWTIEFWFEVPTTPTQGGCIFTTQDAVNLGSIPGFTNTPYSHLRFEVYNFGTPTTYYVLVTPDGSQVSGNTIPCMADGKLHHAVFVWSGTSAVVYIDGQPQVGLPPTPTTTFSGTTTNLMQMGAAAVNAQTLPNAPTFDGDPLIGTVAHLSVYPTALDAIRIDAHYMAGFSAGSGEKSGARATRLLGYGAWQSALQSVQTGRSTMAPASGIAGAQLLSALQDVADSEQGTLTVTADGKVDFRGRDDRMLKLAPTVIFGHGGLPYQLDSSFRIDYDPTYVYNDVLVSRPSGITAEAASATSIVHYFPRQLPITMNVDTDDQVIQAADWLLDRYAEPSTRLESVVVDAGAISPADFPTLWASLLGLDLHERIQFAHQPLAGGNTTLDGFVETLTMTVRGAEGTWTVGFQASPVLRSYAIWDNAATLWNTAVWAF